MTRLISEMISDIPASLPDYDRQLKIQTGCTMLEIALRAAGLTTPPDFSNCQAAVVPVTAGQGLISGFPEAVAAIIAFLGFPVTITETTDVAGFAEALDMGVKTIFMADDRKFMAFNVETGKYTDNGEATGLAFATALDAAAGGLTGKKAAVLGLGPVGRAAVARLVQTGAQPAVFDPDPFLVLAVQDRYQVTVAASTADALQDALCIIDASPAPAIISHEFITDKTIVSCPGVPHGLTAEALEKLAPRRFIHDPLQLGTAVMALKV